MEKINEENSVSPAQIKLRLKFEKSGAMKYIGHLDVMRYFQKLFRRAGTDIAYTTGFHPHQIMSFANPLGVGIESTGEYMDIAMNSKPDIPSLIESLNRENVEGFKILDAALLPEGTGKGMAEVARADYVISSQQPVTGDMISSLMEQPEINIEKKTKKGMKLMDIKPGIHELALRDDGSVFMSLSAGSVLNIRPELVLKAIFDHEGTDIRPFSYHITRLEQYDASGISLLDSGAGGDGK